MAFAQVSCGQSSALVWKGLRETPIVTNRPPILFNPRTLHSILSPKPESLFAKVTISATPLFYLATSAAVSTHINPENH